MPNHNHELFSKLQNTVKYLWQLIGISIVKPTSNNVANIYINPEKKSWAIVSSR